MTSGRNARDDRRRETGEPATATSHVHWNGISLRPPVRAANDGSGRERDGGHRRSE